MPICAIRFCCFLCGVLGADMETSTAGGEPGAMGVHLGSLVGNRLVSGEERISVPSVSWRYDRAA